VTSDSFLRGIWLPAVGAQHSRETIIESMLRRKSEDDPEGEARRKAEHQEKMLVDKPVLDAFLGEFEELRARYPGVEISAFEDGIDVRLGVAVRSFGTSW
jgi:hypothetical protein